MCIRDRASAEAGKAVYFYDANPTINTYAPAEETEFASMVEGVEVSPKLYVKFAQTDVKDNAQTLIINGFANEPVSYTHLNNIKVSL